MNMTNYLSWLYWDPPRDAFTIPFVDITVAWYGILFALGFVIGYDCMHLGVHSQVGWSLALGGAFGGAAAIIAWAFKSDRSR